MRSSPVVSAVLPQLPVCTRILLALLVGLVLAVSGCRRSPDSATGVTLRLTTSEPAPDTGFEVVFDEPMVDFDSVGRMATTPPVIIEPPVTGEFLWRSRRSLLFTPTEPWHLATAHQITLASGLTNLAGKPTAARLSRTFETPGLEASLTSLHFHSDRELPPLPSVRATFNTPVSPKDLARHARFTDGVSTVDAKVTPIPTDESKTTDASPWNGPVTWRERFQSREQATSSVPPSAPLREANTRFLLEPIRRLVSTNEWRAVLTPGLSAALPPSRLNARLEQPLGISPPQQLVDTTVFNSIQRGRSVRLRFTRRVSREILTNDPAAWLTIDPPVRPLDIELDDDDRFVSLRGAFELGRAYRLEVNTRLPGAEGLLPASNAVAEVVFGPVQPTVWLTGRDSVQLAEGRRELAFLSVNVPEVRVRLKQLDRHTLIHTLRSYERYTRYDARHTKDTVPGGPLDYAGVPGRTVLDTNIPVASAIDEPVTTSLPWNHLVPQAAKGAYFIELDRHGIPESLHPSGTAVGPQSIVQLTDIGIASKAGRREVRVWLFSHETAQPIPNARVTLCTHENEVLAEARTGSDGTAVLPRLPKAQWIQAETDDDLHAEPLDAGTLHLWSFGIQGSGRTTDKVHLFAHTDREAYRPGEELRLNGLARTLGTNSWEFPTNSHVQLELRNPRHEVVLRTNLAMREAGRLAWSWKTPTGARGTYTAALSTTQSQGGTELQFEVRDFQPPAFEVSIAHQPIDAPASGFRFPVTARYLFGQPLSHARIAWSVDASDSRFEPEGWSGFHFGADDRHRDAAGERVSSGSVTQTGIATLTGNEAVFLEPVLPLNPVAPQPQRVSVTAEVTDLNQQTVAQGIEAIRHASDFYLGFRWAEREEAVLATNTPLRAHVIAVGTDGKPWPRTVPVTVTVSRVEWASVAVLRAGQTIGYENHATMVRVSESRLSSDPSATTAGKWDAAPDAPGWTQPPQSTPGTYQAEFRTTDDSGRPVLTSVVFHVSGDARVAWHQRNGLSLELVPGRASHQPGEHATLLARTPFSGTAWITLEREDVRVSLVTNLTGNAPALHLPIAAADIPNTYASVTLIRGRAGNPHEHPMPEWRVGFLELPVPPDRDRLHVTFDTPSRAVAPGETVRTSVRVTDAAGNTVPQAWVTLYAVDEGYLQIKGTGLPDPLAAFNAQRPLEVETSLSLHRLLDEDPERRSFDNKGHMAGGGGRSQQQRSRFIPCPYWNTDLRTDADGRVAVSFEAPDSLTRYRLVALATDGPARMGSGTDQFEVRKLLMIESALPRFAHVGDQLAARALVFNTTTNDLTVAVRCQLPSNVAFVSNAPASLQVTVPANSAKSVEFPVVFTQAGDEPWQFRAEAAGLNDGVTAALVVTHAEPSQRAVRSFRVAGTGGSLTEGFNPAMLESAESIQVRVAASPLGLIGESIHQLVHYPYGCVEQTGSSLLPWIALKDFPTLIPTGAGLPTNAMVAINAGVERFWTMQTPQGGLGYWPGDRAPLRWGSAYAAWILALARQAGADVSQPKFDKLLDWLDAQWKADAVAIGPEVLHERCITALALATAGKPAATLHDRLHDERDYLSMEDRGLLALALIHTDRNDPRIRELLAIPAKADDLLGYFGSQPRLLAIRLLVETRLDPTSATAVDLTSKLIAEQHQGHWRTTQGNAWAFLALATQSLQASRSGPIAGSIELSGISAPFVLDALLPVARIERAFATNGTARIARHDGSQPLFVEVTLVARPTPPRDAAVEVNSGFQIQRTFQRLDAQNQPRPVDELHVGDRVLVTLRIDAAEAAAYVAIEDPLPSILEPVQGVFRTEGTRNPLPELSLDYREVRTDRMLFFQNFLSEGRHTIRYLARVRAAGNVVAAPARIEDMYEPDRFGFSSSRRLRAAALP